MDNLITERLILRSWKEDDFIPFFDSVNSDQEVMKYFPSVLSREQSDKLAMEIQRRISMNGWGFWAVEEKSTGDFIGFVGLNQPKIELPFVPCVEIGWRLRKDRWGNGYVKEAATKALDFAFFQLKLDEVISFTAVQNIRSKSVMQRLGMHNTHSNFKHPSVPLDSGLCEHVLYKITHRQWVA